MRAKSTLTIAAGVFLGLLAAFTVYKGPGLVTSFVRKYREISASTHAHDVVFDLRAPEQVIARCGKPLEDTLGLPKLIADHLKDFQLAMRWTHKEVSDPYNEPVDRGEHRSLSYKVNPVGVDLVIVLAFNSQGCSGVDCMTEMTLFDGTTNLGVIDARPGIERRWFEDQDAEGLLSDLPCLDDTTKKRGIFERLRLTFDELYGQ